MIRCQDRARSRHPRRVKVFVFLVVTLITASSASSQAVRLVNPYPPGASSDVMARLFSDRLSASLHAPVIVENRPGAGGAIGAGAVAQSPADGRTLLFVNSGPIVIVPLLQKTGFDPRKDLAPVTQVATNVMILVAHAQTAGSLAELVDQARAQPGRLSYASIGNELQYVMSGALMKPLSQRRCLVGMLLFRAQGKPNISAPARRRRAHL